MNDETVLAFIVHHS